MTFTEDLLRVHASWAVDQTDFEDVPEGWHDLVSELFGAIASVMRTQPGARLRVLQVKEKMGGLRVYWTFEAVPAAAEATLSDAVRDLVATAEAASLLSCDRCGGPGLLRCDAGSYASRCDEHAPPGSQVVDDIGTDAEDAPQAPRAGAPRPEDAVAADRDRPGPGGGRRSPPWCMPLYSLDDVAAALGGRRDDVPTQEDESFMGDPDEREPLPPRAVDNEHQHRLREILAAGAWGRWRDLAAVPPGALDALDNLGRRAPHLDAVTDLVRRHLRAAVAIGLPVALPPVLLVGPPGTGKTWYLSRLAGLLGVPFRSYPMNISTLGEGLSGSHPSWRNSGPGVVARTLLRERSANPVIFVDELDKPVAGGWNRDPYGPLYTLLDRSGSQSFVDEFFQFPLDASAVCWVMSGNSTDPIPEPIMDRLTVVTVPAMSAAQVAAVAASIYVEANDARRGFFDAEPSPSVVDKLLDLNPRSIRVVIEDAMVTAASSGRRTLTPDDLRPRGRRTFRIGFRG